MWVNFGNTPNKQGHCKISQIKNLQHLSDQNSNFDEAQSLMCIPQHYSEI